MLGPHVIKHWSVRQSTVILSSAVAKFTGICKGSTIGLGLNAFCQDMCVSVRLRVHTGAMAAIGMARRRGLGRADVASHVQLPLDGLRAACRMLGIEVSSEAQSEVDRHCDLC